MKDWFDALDVREQWFVSVGAIVVVIMLVYGLGWAPFDKRFTALEADVAQWERSLANLRSLRSIATDGTQFSSAASSATQQSPIIIVDQTLRGRGLDQYRTSSQPNSRNGIRVDFENVAFDELMLWLGDLELQYGMHVQVGNFSVGARVVPGRVNASVTLERAL